MNSTQLRAFIAAIEKGKGVDELIAAAEKAREVLRKVATQRRKLGPIATAAQSAAWQLTYALRAAGKE